MNKVRRILRALVKILPILGGIALLAVIMVWMSQGFGERIEPGVDPYPRPTAQGRELVQVESLSTTEVIEAIGAVQPRIRTLVSSQVLAAIQEITVNASDPVEQGQPLVTLDDREIQAQLGEAEAGMAAAQADLALRGREYDRYHQLYAEKAVTREEYDRVEGALQVTKAQLQRAEQQVKRINVLLSYTNIKAPVGGVVVERFVDPGDLAAPGKPLLAIHDPQDLELHANIRESMAAGVKVGMQLKVQIDAVGLRAEGVVREIVPQAEAASRSVLAKISLPPEATAGLYIGMFGRLSIPVGQTDRTVVQAEAIQHIGQLDLAESVNRDQSLQRKFVRLGRRFGPVVEVLSGLQVGEQVALPIDRMESR